MWDDLQSDAMKEGRVTTALAAVFLVAACGGGSVSGPTASGGAGGTSAPTSAAATGAATARATAASGPALAALLSVGKLTEYKVTYKLTATGSGSAFSGEQSWYFKPPKARFDFTSSMGGSDTTMSIFTLPDGSYMCFGTGGTAQCLGTPATGSPLDQNLAVSFQESLVDHPDQWGGTFVESKTIAGQKGQCYDVKSVAGGAGLSQGRFCWSDKGIPLLQSFTSGGGDWTMEATSVSTTVPDSDFELPAKPTKLP